MADRMRQAPDAFSGLGPISDQLQRQAPANLGPTLRQADQQVSAMNDHARSMQLPQPQVPQMDPLDFMDSQYVGQWDTFMAGEFIDMQDMGLMDPMIADELFIPDSIDESIFFDDAAVKEAFEKDKDFEEFLKGKKKEYSSKEEKKKKLLMKKEAELKQHGLVVKVNSDGSVTITNTKYSAAASKPIIKGNQFQQFMQGKLPSYRGRSKAVADYLVKNRKRLEAKGLSVHTGENGRYLITNNNFKSKSPDPTVFRGSGFRGKDFESFLDGVSPKLEGNNLYRASWLYRNQENLRKSGIHVHVELNSQGRPTGRYSLLNSKMPPPLAPSQRKAISKAMLVIKTEYLAAKALFTKARALRKSGRPADIAAAKKLASSGMERLRTAALMHSSVRSYIGLSRFLYAKRRAVARLPASRKALMQPLLKKADEIISQGASGSLEAQLGSLRKASFLLSLVDTEIYLNNTRSALKGRVRNEIQGFLDKARELFGKNTPQSFERATFILAQARRFTILSLERKGLESEYHISRNTRVNFHIARRMSIFKTKGNFDPAKFEKLTGVKYQDYEKGRPGAVRGLSMLLSSPYANSLKHYDSALGSLRKVIKLASENETPPSALVASTLRKAEHEHRMGAFTLARTAQLEPMYRSVRSLFWMFSKLPKDSDINSIRIGEPGKKELLAERQKVRSILHKTVCAIGRSMFYLTAAQNSPKGKREAILKLAHKAMQNAARYNQEFIKASNEFNDIYSKTIAIVDYLSALSMSGENAALFGKSLIKVGSDHMAKLRTDPWLLRSVFLKTITNPALYRKLKLPDQSRVKALVKSLGPNLLKALYDEKATNQQVSAAADRLLKTKISVSYASTVNADRHHMYNRTYIKMTFEKLLAVSTSPSYLSTYSFPKQWWSESNRKLLVQLKALRDKPASFTADQRRELIFKIIALSAEAGSSGIVMKALNHTEALIKNQFQALMSAHIKQLNERAKGTDVTFQNIQSDAIFLLNNLRPNSLSMMSTNSGIRMNFSRPEMIWAHKRLIQNVASVESIPAEMTEFIPGVMSQVMNHPHYEKMAQAAGAAYQKAHQKYLRTLKRRMLIAGGALIGALIAAPFTAGQSFWAAAGTIGLGIGVGMSIPSLTFAISDYVEVHNDPNATAKERREATKRVWVESIVAATLVLSVVSVATRAWAIGRGSFALARAGYMMDVAIGVTTVGLGGHQMMEGYKLMQKGKTGWGVFNMSLGLLGVVGGGFGVAGGVRNWKTLSSLKLKGATRVETQANIKKFVDSNISNLKAGNTYFSSLSRGKSTAVSTAQLAAIEKSYGQIEMFLAAGGKISKENAAVVSAFKSHIIIQPARDVRKLKKFYRLVSKQSVISPAELSEAITIRKRLEAVRQFRNFSPAESAHLAKMETALKTVLKRDMDVLGRFTKNANPTALDISSAVAANSRIAILQKAIDVPASLVPSQWLQSANLSMKFSQGSRLAEFADDILFGTQVAKGQALARLRLMHPAVRSQVARMVNQSSRTAAITSKLPRAERLRLLGEVGAPYSKNISAINTKLLAQSIGQLKEANALIRKINAGSPAITSRQHIEQITQAHAYAKAFQQSGQKLAPEQLRVFREYASLVVLKRATDMKLIKETSRLISGKVSFAPQAIEGAIAARVRIRNLRELSPLTADQAKGLKRFEQLVGARVKAETSLLQEFNTKIFSGGLGSASIRRNIMIPAQDIKAAVDARSRLLALGKAHEISDAQRVVMSTFNRNLESVQRACLKMVSGVLQVPKSHVAFGQMVHARKTLGQLESLGLLTPNQSAKLKAFDSFLARQITADLKLLSTSVTPDLKALGPKFMEVFDATRRIEAVGKLRKLSSTEVLAISKARDYLSQKLRFDSTELQFFITGFKDRGVPSVERLRGVLEARKRFAHVQGTSIVPKGMPKAVEEFDNLAGQIYLRDVNNIQRLSSKQFDVSKLTPDKVISLVDARVRLQMLARPMTRRQAAALARVDKGIESFSNTRVNILLEMKKAASLNNGNAITTRTIRRVADANEALAPFVKAGLLSPANQMIARTVIGWINNVNNLIVVPIVLFLKKIEPKNIPKVKEITPQELSSVLFAREKLMLMARRRLLSQQHAPALAALEKTLKMAILFDVKTIETYLASRTHDLASTESAKQAYARLVLLEKSGMLSDAQKKTVLMFKKAQK